MIYYICNVIFSILNILLGWIPFGRLSSIPDGIRSEILSKGELNDSPYGQYFVIDSLHQVNGVNVISKELYNVSRTCGGAFCDPRSGIVVIDDARFSSKESLLKEALIAHEFGHCFYQGSGSWMWNSCWCYAIREIQADFFAWRSNHVYAREILQYILKYIPRKTWKDAYLYASMYLFRIAALRIMVMIRS